MHHVAPLGIISAQTADLLVEQSVGFDGAAYLTRTPVVAGNRKTFTVEGWFKRDTATSASTQILFAGGSVTGATDTSWFQVFINADGTFGVGGGATNWRVSAAKLAGTSGWYHIAVVVDTTQATAADRIKLFVNGVQITDFGTNNAITLNADTGVNSAAIHTIGRRDDATRYFTGRMALWRIIDGAAITPEGNYLETDANNYIKPNSYTPTGTNAVLLDFANTGYFGKDAKAEYAAIGATWRASASSDTDASSYTFSSLSIGTADADRYVIAAIMSQPTSSGTPTACTIGGVSAALIDSQTFNSGSGNYGFVYFYKANVPTGTTADVVATISGTIERCGCSVWTTTGDVQVMDAQADIASGTTPDNSLTVTLQRPDNGFVVAAVEGQGDSGDPTFTWGGTGITERHETGWGDRDATHGSASGDFTSASSAAVTVTNTTGNMYYYILSALALVPTGDNSFAATGFAPTDQLSDSPTDDSATGIGNFCQWDADCDNGNSAYTVSEYGTKIQNAAGQDDGWWGTLFVDSGKWYFEATLGAVSTGNPSIGVVSNSVATSGDAYDISVGDGFDFGGSGEAYTYHATGNKINDSAYTSYGVSYTTNDVIGIALDLDNGAIWFSKNGTWLNSATVGEIEAGTTTNAAFTGLTSGEFFAPFCHNGSANVIWTLNCGDKAFSGSAPNGFNKIATHNLPTDHPLYVEGAAQLRAGLQIHSVTFSSDDSGKENASFRQTYNAANTADQAFTRVRFLLEGHSSSTCQYDNLSTGIHTSGGSTAATPVPITVNGATAVTLLAGAKVWTDWVELTGTAGQVPVLIADIASTNGNLRRLDGGSNTFYEKASTNSYATADISGAGFSSGTRTYIGSKIEVQ